MKRVYIAGKLKAETAEYVRNIHDMIVWAEKIRKLGFAVFIPGIDFLIGLQIGDWEYEDYFNNSQPFLEVCDYIFVCPDSENSKGVQKEIKLACRLRIPVIHSLEELESLKNRIN